MAKRTRRRHIRTASPEESWLPVPDYESSYEVSDHGQVRRIAPGHSATVGYILKPMPTAKGYLRVILAPQPGTTVGRRVHLLVLRAFVGPAPTGHEANHRDGDKTNNHVSNLEWVTRAENMRHAFRNGLQQPVRGEQHGMHKLTRAQAVAIRALRGQEPSRLTASRFGISKSTVSDIQCGRTWREG